MDACENQPSQKAVWLQFPKCSQTFTEFIDRIKSACMSLWNITGSLRSFHLTSLKRTCHPCALERRIHFILSIVHKLMSSWKLSKAIKKNQHASYWIQTLITRSWKLLTTFKSFHHPTVSVCVYIYIYIYRRRGGLGYIYTERYTENANHLKIPYNFSRKYHGWFFHNITLAHSIWNIWIDRCRFKSKLQFSG